MIYIIMLLNELLLFILLLDLFVIEICYEYMNEVRNYRYLLWFYFIMINVGMYFCDIFV